MDIISRAKAGLPSVPASISHRSIDSWTGITGHHTGGNFSSWAAIHHWQTKGRPPGSRLADIGYSFGIAGGRVTELRGWTRHPAGDHDNSRLQVVFGGDYNDALPAREDLDAFVAFVIEARRRTGKTLAVIPHRGVWPAGHKYATSCPGDRLAKWMRQELPDLLAGPKPTPTTPKEDSMKLTDKVTLRTDGEVKYSAKTTTVEGVLTSTNYYVLQSRNRMLAELADAKLRDEAILRAVTGGSQEQVLATIREQGERTRAELAAVAAAEVQRDAELAELVRQGNSGELDAAEVVRLIGERLAAPQA